MRECHWIRWGSNTIGSWENKHNPPELELHHPSEEESYLDHGYDEEKGLADLDAEDLQKAAEFRGGHWCPECLRKSWAYPKIARKNPFYAQVWDPQHSLEETYEIPMEYSAYEIAEELKEKLGL